MNDGSLIMILSACAGPQAKSYTMELCGLLLSNATGLCCGHKSEAEHVTMAAQSVCSMDSAYRTSLEPSSLMQVWWASHQPVPWSSTMRQSSLVSLPG